MPEILLPDVITVTLGLAVFPAGAAINRALPVLQRFNIPDPVAVGVALGATPTAIANVTTLTRRYGPSPIAFTVLPLVSAFFVDIANSIVIQAIVNF